MEEKLINDGFKVTDAIICGWDQHDQSTYIQALVYFSPTGKALDGLKKSEDGKWYNNGEKISKDYVCAAVNYYAGGKGASKINSAIYKPGQKIQIYYKEYKKIGKSQFYTIWLIENNQDIIEEYKKKRRKTTNYFYYFIALFFAILIFLVIYISLKGW